MFINLFKTQPAQLIKKEYTEVTAANIGILIAPWITLLIGWLVKILILKSI
jgi:hypothetical protein